MDVEVILGQMMMLFSMMIIGYVLWKNEWFNDYAYRQLSKLVVNILNPILVVEGVLGKSSAGHINLILQNLVLCIIFFLFLIIVGVAIAYIIRPNIREWYMYELMAAVPNVGFMGIPVITSVLGSGSMIYIVFYMLISNILIYTYGVVLMKKTVLQNEGRTRKSSIKEQFKQMLNPGVVSCVIAAIIFFMQIDVPSPVMNFCDYMGNATIPLSMLLIGMSIAKSNLKKSLYQYESIRFFRFTHGFYSCYCCFYW